MSALFPLSLDMWQEWVRDDTTLNSRPEAIPAIEALYERGISYYLEARKHFDKASLLYDQVLTYAQQSQECLNYEQAALNERMQEYKRQIDREIRWSSNGSNGSPNGDGIQTIGRSSHKMIEAVMQSASKGKVRTSQHEWQIFLSSMVVCY